MIQEIRKVFLSNFMMRFIRTTFIPSMIIFFDMIQLKLRLQNKSESGSLFFQILVTGWCRVPNREHQIAKIEYTDFKGPLEVKEWDTN